MRDASQIIWVRGFSIDEWECPEDHCHGLALGIMGVTTLSNFRIHAMKQVHNGFTLIEIMVGVVVVGVLAAVAISSYQGYVTSARISEAVVMTSTAKISLGEACTSGVLSGATNASLGLPTAAAFESPKVLSSIVAVGNSVTEATVTVTLKSFGEVEAGQTLVYKGVCSPGGVSWAIDPSSTVPVHLLPKE